MTPPGRSYLASRKRTVIALRGIMTLAVAALSLPQIRTAPASTFLVLGVYAATNIVLLFEKPSAFLKRLPEMALFVFDVATVVVLMLLTGETRSQFYVTFFLIILMAGLSKSARVTIALACISAGVYGFMVGITRPEELLEVGFTTRIALFFITALFSGYMAEEIHRERGEHHRFEGFYRTLFEQSADGILVSGTDDVIRQANSRARKMLGIDPAGKRIWEVMRVSDAGLPAAAQGPASPLSRHSIFALELLRSDGQTLTCEVTLRHLSVEGETYRLLLLRDVGEVRQLQKRMAELEKMSILGQFIASITHEINNPLAVINGYAQLLQEGALPAEEKEYAGYIREAGERCKRVVDGFLDQYRSKPFSPVPTRLATVVQSAARLMEFHLRYNLVKMELTLDESAEVLADPQQIEQLLINLISNAVKAMEGRPTKALRIRMLPLDRENAVEVYDTGCGISPENIGRLFTRGFTSRGDGSGHGIGLSLSQEIAHRHGGQITVASRQGEGTAFTLHLPRMEPAEKPAETSEAGLVPAAPSRS